VYPDRGQFSICVAKAGRTTAIKLTEFHLTAIFSVKNCQINFQQRTIKNSLN